MKGNGGELSQLCKKKIRTYLLSSLSPNPGPNRPQSRIKVPQKRKKKNLDLGLTLKSHGPPTHPTHPTHPQLLSMKESSGKKVQKIKVAQNDPLDSPS